MPSLAKQKILLETALKALRASEIGEFVRFKSCERRFKLEFDKRAEARKLPFADRLFNTLDPVLQEMGRERELQWQKSLDENGFKNFFDGESLEKEDERKKGFESFFDLLPRLEKGKNLYAREVPLFGEIGGFSVQGRADFILVSWVDGKPYIKIVECKSSRKDKTYHRIQIAIYRLLFEDNLSKRKLRIGDQEVTKAQLKCVVGRVNEDTNDPQPILELPDLDLEMEVADVRRLAGLDGALERILSRPLSDLNYQLDSKCDSCVFNVHCFSESGRTRALQLLGFEPAIVRVFAKRGIRTIDSLADLDLNSELAKELISNPELNIHLENFVIKAKARRSNLPGPKIDKEYPVLTLKNPAAGLLPAHVQEGDALVRLFLCVDYDYVENRIGAISAHVTNSDHRVVTRFEKDVGPIPEIEEAAVVDGKIDPLKLRPLVGKDIVKFITSPWTGVYNRDTGTEKQMIQDFFFDLTESIAEVADNTHARIHFYVWSKSEMSHLVEACSRAGSDLLGRLKELLGCREPTEQLIYSSLQEEVNNKFALGWTGRGLTVVTSLPWFGQRYHWTRKVNNEVLKLDHEFTQDLFDFKTTLDLDENGSWTKQGAGTKSVFEIRSRFFDSLSAPYWRAVWKRLKVDDHSKDAKLKNSIERYNRAGRPGLLKAYLKSRCHALRWVEEKIYKNDDVLKPRLEIEKIRDFRLNIDSTVDAGIDFLQLDHHVGISDWIATQLAPPKYRILGGKMLPIKNLTFTGGNEIKAEINIDGYSIDRETLKLNCEVGEGFARVTICDEDPSRGQTIKQFFRYGSTCVVKAVDWDAFTVTFSVLPQPTADRYRLSSLVAEYFAKDVKFATIDDSPSDYVAGTVEAQLVRSRGTFINRWFHPERPIIPESRPLDGEKRALYERFLYSLLQPNGTTLGEDQIRSVLDGLSSTIQILQGPPGTGKTTTTSNAVLLRIADAIQPGSIILISSLTHMAIDGLLKKIAEVLPLFQAKAEEVGIALPKVVIGKVDSGFVANNGIIQISEKSPTRAVCGYMADSCLILGGTTGKIIKMVTALNEKPTFPKKNGNKPFSAPLLIIDEASMLVFPYFLSLASFVSENGKIMLAGDHRQLSPIVSNDWDSEDRPPAVLYKPFVSSYVGIDSIKTNHQVTDLSLKRSFLDFSFRLPPSVRELIAKIYAKDNIKLKGSDRKEVFSPDKVKTFEDIWKAQTGLYLVIHDEAGSRRSNIAEAQIINKILDGSKLDDRSTAVITPHRAQRTLLKRVLKDHSGPVDVIDTVERMQGGERPNIFVSGTVSDPTTISNRAEFILNLNRANVAFSRTQNRLFVVCARSLLDHIPPDSDDYESAMLWKAVREVCNVELFGGKIDSCSYKVFTFDRSAIKL